MLASTVRVFRFPLSTAAHSQLQRIYWLKESAAPPNFTCSGEPTWTGGEKTETAHLFAKASVLHRGTLLNIIQMRKNIFPAYLKSPGAAARTTGADSPLSFVGAIVGAYTLGLGV